jgi:hypothetical protein
LKAAKLLHCISGWIKPLVLPLKVRPVEEPAGYPPISFSMLLMSAEFVCFAVDRVKLRSSLIGGKFLYGSKQHHEGALSRLLSGLWPCSHQTVQSKLLSLRMTAFHYAIGVYDKRVPGFEHQLP